MATYLLSVHTTDEPADRSMTDEERRRAYEPIAALEAEMRAAGVLVFSGRLSDALEARVVRPAGKRIRKTDGPFVETKEHLGGFYVLEAADLEAALDWASRVTRLINTPIEVRPFVGFAAA